MISTRSSARAAMSMSACGYLPMQRPPGRHLVESTHEDVLQHRRAVDQIEALEDHADIGAQLTHAGTARGRGRCGRSRSSSPRGERNETVDRTDQGGLAGPGEADDHDELAVIDFEIEVLHRRHPVGVGDVGVGETNHVWRDRDLVRRDWSVDDQSASATGSGTGGPRPHWYPAPLRRRRSRSLEDVAELDFEVTDDVEVEPSRPAPGRRSRTARRGRSRPLRCWRCRTNAAVMAATRDSGRSPATAKPSFGIGPDQPNTTTFWPTSGLVSSMLAASVVERHADFGVAVVDRLDRDVVAAGEQAVDAVDRIDAGVDELECRDRRSPRSNPGRRTTRSCLRAVRACRRRSGRRRRSRRRARRCRTGSRLRRRRECRRSTCRGRW